MNKVTASLRDKSFSWLRIVPCAYVLAAYFVAPAAFGAEPTHLDMLKNPVGCEACHQGHGKKGTAMLRAKREESCFTCHGASVTPGIASAKTDMLTVFNKRYKHPVRETGHLHSSQEELPEKSSAVSRHVACDDCHKVHLVDAEKKWKGSKGYTKTRARGREAREEYELCYQCHADSVNLPFSSKNKKDQFDTSNASYHPIEGYGRNTNVPSLLSSAYTVRSMITCSDCHGNDDVYGPKGPHGSNYEFMLKKRYTVTEASEAQQTYELCYACHDRNNLLSNASFKKHKEHIVYHHIPCSACHTPHGSIQNPHLIEFDEKFVASSPMPTYMPARTGRPLCFLKCHVGSRDVLHDNAFYQLKRWP